MVDAERFVQTPRSLRIGVGAFIGVVVLAIGGTVAWGVLQSSSTNAATVVEATPDAAAAQLYVHVSGSVVSPGLYALSADARVADAIAAAGGFADDADVASVNLARKVDDGEQVIVASTATTDGQSPSVADTRININTATAAELETLPRIGPALAQRIIEWREANGQFSSVEDLKLVSGIGDKLFSGIVELVRV